MSLRSKLSIAWWALKNQKIVRQVIHKQYDLITGQGQNIDIIRNSEYFDAEWYLRNNIDLQDKYVDPARHYLLHGGFELRDPSAEFCSEEYYTLHQDAKKARMNPLLHYELFGRSEGRTLYEQEEALPVFPEGLVETEKEFTLAPVRHRRAAVLSCFLSDGIIPDTLFYLIRGLREVVDQIFLVGDCPVDSSELDKLEGLVTWCRFERHMQYDFGSYRRGLKYAREHGFLDPANVDELVFLNDSCYGPVFPFSEMFDRMTAKPNQFWGINDYQSFNKKHVSTYCVVFKKKIVYSDLLDQFLMRVDGQYDRGRVIATLETELTTYLTDHGMRFDLYAEEPGKNLFNYPVTFLEKYRVPLVKKKAFSREGKEDQLEALRIIKENAPDLAAMIHYEPFQQREHHFPSVQEHLDSFNAICERIAQKAKNGEKIRVLFLVFHQTFFPSKPLFNAMTKDNMFDPHIAVIPDRRWGGIEYQVSEMAECEEALLKEGILSQYLILPERDELDRWPDICSEQDIVCYNTPYYLTSYRYEPRYSVGRSFLPIMVNYGFYRSRYDDKLVSLDSYSYLWKAFFECEDSMQQYREHSAAEGRNGDVVGYIKMDPLASVHTEKHDRKRIFVALHHSVEGGINHDLELGNFVRYSDYFLSLPDRYPDIDFVFRPHPHLFQVLLRKNLWSQKEVDDYSFKLSSKPNVIWSSGEDYFKEFAESDGCIQDCGSYLVEYLYTGKPCCYMLKDPSDIEKKFAPLGQKCLEQCYISYDTNAIDSFIENVILNGKDEKAETRSAFAQTVMINYPHASEAAIESIIRDIFATLKSSDSEKVS